MNTGKSICHVTSAHPAEDGRIFRRACIAAAEAGYTTYLVEQGESYDKQGVHIIGTGYPKKKGRLYRMTIFTRKVFKAALDTNADIYQLHDPELLPYAIRLKKRGKAVIFDSHEDYVEQIRSKPYLPNYIAEIASRVYGIYSRFVFSHIDGLTYPGTAGVPSTFDHLCKRVVPTDNLPWLYELYDRYIVKGKEANTACYIGILAEERGVTQVVKACHKAKCKLYLAGRFSSAEYKKRIESLPEYENVEYMGVLDREAIASLLNNVSVGVCTLLNVGQYYKMSNLPTKVYEYMSMAVPVIVNDSYFNKMMVDKYHFGECVDPQNISQFSKVLRSLLNDPELQKMYGNNGRKAIKDNLCWDKEKKNLIEMYESILNNNKY